MKILLVNQPIYDSFDLRRMEPLGLAYIAAVLETHGYGKDVEILDPNLSEKPDSIRIIREDILSRDPDIVGFSTFSNGFQYTLRISHYIKKFLPRAFIIFGGHLATALHDTILKKFHQVDIVVRGEGEYTMLDLVRAFNNNKGLKSILGISYRENNRIQINDPRPLVTNLDELPFPARHKLPSMNRSIATMLSSRGCPYNCNFCDVSSFYRASPGLFWRARSVNNVVDEIEYLLKKGVELIHFVDACFLVNPHRVKGICREIQKRNLRFSFTLNTRADQIVRNSSLLPLLQQSGCIYAEMGMENGCQDVLDRYGKQLKVSDNVKALELLRKSKIGYSVDFILFDKYTTMEELSTNLKFVEENNLSLESDLFFTYMRPYPGTRIHKQYLSEKSLRGSVVAPIYHIKDKRASWVFEAISKFKTDFEAERRRKIDEIENKLDEIDNLMHMMECVLSSSNDWVIGQLDNLNHAYRYQRIAILRFPYLFFKLIMQEAKKGTKTIFRHKCVHWLRVFRKNLEKQYKNVDELHAKLKEIAHGLRDGRNEIPIS